MTERYPMLRMTHDFETGVEALVGMGRAVMAAGELSSPRGMSTKEVLGVQFTIRDSTDCLATGIGRNFNTRLAAAEILQILGGFADEDWMDRVAPRYLELVDGKMTGAYGPRLRDQLPVMVEMLRKDPNTRQAVATIWDPERDVYKEHGDRPCTVYFHFLIRNGGLVTMTRMRSQDVFLGLTYDLPMFSAVHLTMANVLGIPAKLHVHSADSLHAYERDFEAIKKISLTEYDNRTRMVGIGHSFSHAVIDWTADVMFRAHHLARLGDDMFERLGGPLNDFERWLRDNSKDGRVSPTR